jgi:hypothetical protein
MDNFFSVNIDGKKIDLEIQAATLKDQRESQKVYNQAFSDAIKSGSIVRAKLDDLLKDQGLWDDNKEIQFKTLQKQILDNEKKLAKGGIPLNAAKNIALKIYSFRQELRNLISVKTELDTHTAEGQADNARFNYLVSACVVYKNTSNKYFTNYEDYLNRAGEEVAVTAAQKLASMMYGLDNDFEKKLPENKFLLKYNFVNEDLQLVDDKGRLVDSDGRLIDKNGRFINEDGKFVDQDGNLVDEKGDWLVDFEPFLDDDGKPIKETEKDEVTENPTEKNAEEKSE